MKKFLICALALIALAGCETEPKADDRLVGTKWQTEDDLYEIFFGGVAYDVYEFVSVSQVEHYTTQNGNVVDMDGTFEYELNYPKIVIHATNSDGEAVDYNFTFTDSRTMVRDGVDSSNFYSTYLRQ